MRTIRIVLTYPNKFQLHSWITALRLGRPYSHAAIVMTDDETKTSGIVQASHGMVHEMYIETFSSTHHFVKTFTLYLRPEQFVRGRTWMKKQLGKKYSFLGMISATVPLLRFLGLGKDGDKEFICSEFCFRFLEEALGIDIIPTGRGFDDYVDPEVLEGVLVKMEEHQTIMGLNFAGHGPKEKPIDPSRPEPLPVSSKGVFRTDP